MRVIDSDRFRGPSAASLGGSSSGGGGVDDILKRLSALEVSVGGILATLPHLVTKADLAKVEGALGSRIAEVEGSLASRIAKVEGSVTSESARLEGSIASAIAKLEGSMIKWMVGTIISAVAAAFAVAKFVS